MKKIKYNYGTTIENPATALAENEIALARAAQKAKKNGLVVGTQIFGNLAQTVGTSMMNKGIADGEGADGKGVAGFLNKNSGNIQSGLGMLNAFSQFMAMGGMVGGTGVEVEGEEVGEMPNGQLLDFKGPSHEQGGIPVALPEGTEIYSKRIKVDGVSMADRKKKREKKTMSLESLFESNKTDALIKNSLSRTKETNEVEEGADNKIQMVVKQLLGKPEQHAWGTPVGEDPNDPFGILAMIQNGGNLMDNNVYGGYKPQPKATPTVQIDDLTENNGYSNPELAPEASTTNMGKNPSGTSSFKNVLGDALGGVTFGDAIGLAGNLVSTFGPMKNTQANRAGDKPNINAFENYGKEGLDTLDESKKYVNQVRAQKLKDLELARTSSIKRNSNSTRSLNVNRALNLAVDANVNNAQEETYNSFAEQLLGILGNEAVMKNQRDQVVMGGEQSRDLADRQDRDNYYSQMAQDIATKGQGLQETGYDVNKIKERKVMQNLLNQLSAYGITIDKEGNLSNPNKK